MCSYVKHVNMQDFTEPVIYHNYHDGYLAPRVCMCVRIKSVLTRSQEKCTTRKSLRPVVT